MGEREALVERTKLLVAFLMGEGTIDGVWFGDNPVPAMPKGKFWWRKMLRRDFDALLALIDPAPPTDNPPVDHPVARVNLFGEDVVMVPREPTEEMIEAGTEANAAIMHNYGDQGWRSITAAIYRAMLDAAPTMDGGGS